MVVSFILFCIGSVPVTPTNVSPVYRLIAPVVYDVEHLSLFMVDCGGGITSRFSFLRSVEAMTPALRLLASCKITVLDARRIQVWVGLSYLYVIPLVSS